MVEGEAFVYRIAAPKGVVFSWAKLAREYIRHFYGEEIEILIEEDDYPAHWLILVSGVNDRNVDTVRALFAGLGAGMVFWADKHLDIDVPEVEW